MDAALAKLRHYYVYDGVDNGRFDRFMWKYRFFQRLWAYGWDEDAALAHQMPQHVLRHHQQQGLTYVEYRCCFWGEPDEHRDRLRLLAVDLKNASRFGLDAKLIVPLPRTDPLPTFEIVVSLLRDYPALRDTIVGVDFSSIEERGSA